MRKYLMATILCISATLNGPEVLAQQTVPVPTKRPEIITDPAESNLPPNGGSGALKNAGEVKVVPQTGPPYDFAETIKCEAELRSRKLDFTAVEEIDDVAGCGAERPLLLKGLGNGVKVAGKVLTRCEVALALDKWVVEAVVPSAVTQVGKKISEISISTSYQCRSRNNVVGAKLSEHAFANGIDVMGFVFEDGKRVSVMQREDGEENVRAFQAAARGAACAYFTTVIGPGTNASHKDHFHLDLAYRKGGYRLCE